LHITFVCFPMIFCNANADDNTILVDG
jgi:hypothetical protein